MIFIVAGMGSGTGTGASPVIAKLAKDLGILTIAVVNTPFSFEYSNKKVQASNGIKALKECVDVLITIPCQKILETIDRMKSIMDLFSIANNLLHQGVESICDLIIDGGSDSVSFADLKAAISGTGEAYIGIGLDSGENRARMAVEKAISSPFLKGIPYNTAKIALIKISGSENLGKQEVDEAMAVIRDVVAPDAVVLSVVSVDLELDDKMNVTVVLGRFLS